MDLLRYVALRLPPVDSIIVYRQEWAQDFDYREHLENIMNYCYYFAYGLVFLCIFIVLPFVYFFYEAKDEDGYESDSRVCSAIKFTLAFVFVAVVLLLLG